MFVTYFEAEINFDSGFLVDELHDRDPRSQDGRHVRKVVLKVKVFIRDYKRLWLQPKTLNLHIHKKSFLIVIVIKQIILQ